MKKDEWPDTIEAAETDTDIDSDMPEGLRQFLDDALLKVSHFIYADMRKAMEKERAFYERMGRMGAKRKLLLRLAFCRRENMTPVLDEKEQKLYWSLLTPWQRFWRTVLEGGIDGAYRLLSHSRRR